MLDEAEMCTYLKISPMSLRRTFSLLDGWKFSLSANAEWSEVTLPHTYNAEDGSRGGAYYRGTAFYRRKLPLEFAMEGGRKFLHFEGCILKASVKVEGNLLKVHRGGYTGFYVEIPSGIRPGAEIEVEIDNSRQKDNIPLAGDFTIFGGIYRPVYGIVTGDICFLPTPCGSDGVRILNQKVEKTTARVTWSVNASGDGELRHSVRDAAGNVMVAESYAIKGNHEAETAIENPVLWQGLRNPHQYEFIWELVRDGQCVDRITRKIGLRTWSRDEQGGILLNGEKIVPRGVCKHQDTAGKAVAVSAEDLRRDMVIARELGANAIRLAHYPHAQLTYELCDELGMMVWTEIPLVNELYKTEEFRETVFAQLREMIGQLSHHASIFCWGIFNELYSSVSDRWTELVAELHAEAKALDPSRFTACAGHAETPVEIRNITDLLATNAYPGWYHSKPEDMATRITEWNASGGGRGVGVSEYGAGGNPWQHEEPPAGPYPTVGFWHPEEWQCYCHERQYEAIRQSPETWGSFVWVFFDFYSDWRNEGGLPGINNKGLVTVDRALKKDIFFFYQAHWSENPVLHIASKRNYKPRHAPSVIRVYSNCSKVSASLDGVPLPASRLVFGVVHEFDLHQLSEGEHVVEVSGEHEKGTIGDRRQFVLN